MAQQFIDVFASGSTRNKINSNFTELYENKDIQELAFKYINSDSLIKPGTIHPGQTSFVKNVGKNLFDGTYSNSYTILTQSTLGDVVYVDHDPDNPRVTALIPLESDKTYTLTKYSGGNRFNAVLVDKLPTPYDKYVDSIARYYGGNTSARSKWTFDNKVHKALYLLVVVSVGSGDKPNVQLEEGSESTDFEKAIFEFDGSVNISEVFEIGDNTISYSKTDFIKHGKNLFDGKFSRNYAIQTLSANNVLYVTGEEENQRRSVVVRLEDGETYTVTKYDGGNRFNLVTVDDLPNPRTTPIKSIYDYTGPQSSSKHSHTFKNEGANYLIVQISLNNDNLPLVQVEKGGVETEYEQFQYVFDNPIKGTLIGDDTNGLYSPNGYFRVQDVDMETFPVASQMNIDIILDKYDELVSEFPDYITKEEIGETRLGTKLYAYSFIPNVVDVRASAQEFDISKPKIIISTSTHGSEKTPVYCTYNFFRKLCREWKNNDHLAYLRFNVDFILIPFVNPDGFNAHTRTNSNEVDINRDFPRVLDPEDSYSDRELETQAIIETMRLHDDADFWIDFHVMNQGDYIMYSTGRSKVSTVTASRTMATVGKMMQKEYDYLPQDDQYQFGYSVAGQMNTVTDCNNGSGIPAMTMEMVSRLKWDSNSSANNQPALKLGVEYLANAILYRVKQVETRKMLELD